MVIALSIIANPHNWVAAPAIGPAMTDGPSLYQPGGRHRSISAALALGGAAIVIAGLMTALVAPEILPHFEPPIDVTNYPLPVPPPPKPQNDPPRHDPVLTVPRPVVDIPVTIEGPVISDPIDFTLPSLGGVGSGGGTGDVTEFVPPPPLFTAARRNPRFARDFQPPYPSAQQREGVEGRCPVSVTIAPSGRVSAVRDAGCTDPAFFRATQNQALNRWRFEPATRNGVAMESTLTQTVVFRIDQ